jgi:type VI protein secretion system component Hcp
MRALYKASIIVTVLTLAVSGQALAGGKGGGGHESSGGPKGNVSLNYGKIEQSYKPQSADGARSSGVATGPRITNVRTNSAVSAKKTGKTHVNDISITKKSDKSSPKLY